MNLRLFCALRVPSDVQEGLVTTSNSLRGVLSPASISWVKRGNFHLTLSFLGDVDEVHVEKIAVGLRAACQESRAFELVCRGLGCFPNVNRPRVLWAGLQGAEAELLELQKRVAAVCAAFAEKEEKGRFSGHITLGRIRAIEKPVRGRLAGELDRNRDKLFGKWTVDEVELLCSDLSQGAPRYSILHRVSLTR